MRALMTPALLATALIASGCGTDAVTKPVSSVRSPHASVAQQAGRPLPLAGRCDVTSSQPLGFEPPVLHQISTASCTVSHLGRLSVRTVQHVNTVTGVQVAEGTWTTANGDLLYVTSLGTATPTGPTSIEFTGVTTIVGGTGRFAGAGGQVNVEGASDTATGTGNFTYDGWILYDASDRRSR